MRTVSRTRFVGSFLLLAYCFASVCLGQNAPPPKIVIVPAPTAPVVGGPPTIAQYKEVFTGLEEITKNVFDEEKWKAVSFRHRVTKKVVKWSDFTDFEKKLYCLTMSEQVEARLVYIQKAWTWELNRFKNPAHLLGIAEFNKDLKATDDKRAATKEDVEKYLVNILVLRKTLAKEVESVTVDTFKRYSDKIPQAERDSWLKKLRAKHDKEKLIDRSPVVAPPVPGKKDAKVPSDG